MHLSYLWLTNWLQKANGDTYFWTAAVLSWNLDLDMKQVCDLWTCMSNNRVFSIDSF